MDNRTFAAITFTPLPPRPHFLCYPGASSDRYKHRPNPSPVRETNNERGKHTAFV